MAASAELLKVARRSIEPKIVPAEPAILTIHPIYRKINDRRNCLTRKESSARRGGRVVDGGGLENHCTRKGTRGSNPFPSAIRLRRAHNAGAAAARCLAVAAQPRRRTAKVLRPCDDLAGRTASHSHHQNPDRETQKHSIRGPHWRWRTTRHEFADCPKRRPIQNEHADCRKHRECA